MTPKKAALIWILLLASLTMTAQTSPNQAAFLMAVATLPLVPSQTPASNLSPVVGAQQWLEALNTQDDTQIQKLTCQDQQENLRRNSAWVVTFPVLTKLSSDLIPQIEGIVSTLEIDIIGQNETRARVRVHGNLPVIGPGLMAVYEVDERWWLVHEDGAWHWCGTSPGEATPTLTPTVTSTPWPITRSPTGSSSSPSVWKILSVFAAVLGAIGKIYRAIHRKRNETH